MNIFPLMIFGICHGKTEKHFFKVVNKYIELKFDELNGNWIYKPTTRYLKNWNSGCSVTVNNFE